MIVGKENEEREMREGEEWGGREEEGSDEGSCKERLFSQGIRAYLIWKKRGLKYKFDDFSQAN